MRWWTNLRLRVDALLHRRRWEAELDEELAFHIERETRENVANGMTPREARRRALRDFGGVEWTKERYRDQRGFRPLEDALQDLRLGLRALLNRPGFSATVVLTLAIGVGLNAAVFTAVDHLLLRDLPYPDPEGLVLVHGRNTAQSQTRLGTSWEDFYDIQDEARSFARMAVYNAPFDVTVLDPSGRPTLMSQQAWGEGVMAILGVEPLLGRPLRPEDFTAGEARVAYLSQGAWEARYGGDPGILGTRLELPLWGRELEIIGVVPSEAAFPDEAELLVPLPWVTLHEEEEEEVAGFGRDWRTLGVIGRLTSGRSPEAAAQELTAIGTRLSEVHPGTNQNHELWLEGLRDAGVRDVSRPLLLLQGVVALVLLIACANVANLLYARGTVRMREVAVRRALGGSRSRIVRQLLMETLTLTLAGGLAGLLMAGAALGGIQRMLPPSLEGLGGLELDARVVAIMMGLAMLAGVVAGLAPALAASRSDVRTAMQSGLRTGVGLPARRVQRGLVILETALSTVLVAAAVLVATSFQRSLQVDPGFTEMNVLSVRISVSPPRYEAWEGYRTFMNQVFAEVQRAPGVDRAALSFNDPVRPGGGFEVWFEEEGRPVSAGERPTANMRPVTPGFFQTVGLPLLRGRDILPTDTKHAQGVVVVNEALVARYFPDRDPLGARITKPPFWQEDDGYPQWHTIVGVVGDVRASGLTAEAEPALYFPYDQTPFGNMRLLVSADGGDPMAVLPAVEEAVWRVDAAVPMEAVSTVEAAFRESMAPMRFSVRLVTAFALLALVLAGIGLYGVQAYAVARRTPELGLRQALGAGRSRIVGLVVRQGMALAGIGAAVGVLISLGTNRLIQGMLFDVRPTEPGVLVLVVAVLAAASLLATVIPARRAARVEPREAIGQDG